MLRGKIRPGEGEEYFIPGDRGRSPGKELMEQRLGGSEGEPWMAFGKSMPGTRNSKCNSAEGAMHAACSWRSRSPVTLVKCLLAGIDTQRA